MILSNYIFNFKTVINGGPKYTCKYIKRYSILLRSNGQFESGGSNRSLSLLYRYTLIVLTKLTD